MEQPLEPFFQVLRDNCWVLGPNRKGCYKLIDGEYGPVGLLMHKFGLHAELANEIVQAWVNQGCA